VRQADVERQLLLLNDLPGVTARAAFTPGASTGAADVVVSVAEEDPLEIRFDFSNHGSRSTGVYRGGLQVQLRDLFGWGDTTTARALVSARGGLVSGSLSTSVPVGGDGYKLGLNLSRLKYQLSGEFASLGAEGTADVVGVDASYPLVRTQTFNLGVKASAEHRQLSDSQLVRAADRKINDVGELSASLDLRDGWGGASAGSATVSMGRLDQASSGSTVWRKLGYLAARQQALAGPWSLYGRIAGQYTGSSLDSSEKFGLGGPGAVRAYASGEASVDLGTLVSLELRHAQDMLGGNVVLSLFHDRASGGISRLPLEPAGNHVRLSGSGLGLSWNSGAIGLNASLAWRGSRAATVDAGDGEPRLYLQLSVTP
jgi:hemolysin activation/secretion protein